MSQKRYMTAKEATTRLGVSVQTLYAYVSRGLIRSEVVPGNTRKHYYLSEDVIRLVDRKAQRNDPVKVTQEALHWGAPLLESALTLIADDHLYYRGQDACELAQTSTFEQIAALLWTESTENATAVFNSQGSKSPVVTRRVTAACRGSITAMSIALALALEHDLAAYDLAPANVAHTGARILRLLTRAITDSAPQTTIAATLAKTWGIDHARARVIDAALILCADHELNASSFTARVVASTEANPYAVVSAGLAALQGALHGGFTRRVSAFLREVEQAGDIQAVIRARLQRGDDIPGFGHRLYAEGDPRAALLLRLLEQTGLHPRQMGFALAVSREVQQATGKAPTIDFALVVLERALCLPPASALALFALGRTAGWIAHAIEQYSTGELIRPRARYTGTLPAD
jgi:citrate synthase